MSWSLSDRRAGLSIPSSIADSFKPPGQSGTPTHSSRPCTFQPQKLRTALRAMALPPTQTARVSLPSVRVIRLARRSITDVEPPADLSRGRLPHQQRRPLLQPVLIWARSDDKARGWRAVRELGTSASRRRVADFQGRATEVADGPRAEGGEEWRARNCVGRDDGTTRC